MFGACFFGEGMCEIALRMVLLSGRHGLLFKVIEFCCGN